MALALIKRLTPSHDEVVHIYHIDGMPSIDFCKSIFRHPELSFSSVTADIDTVADGFPDTVRSVHNDEELDACTEIGMVHTVNILAHYRRKSVEMIVHLLNHTLNICARDEAIVKELKDLLA